MNDPLFEISNSISDMGIIIGKGMVALDALTQNYFNKVGVSTKDLSPEDNKSLNPSYEVLANYAYYNTVTEIAFDYFYDLEQRLEALDKRINQLRKESGTAAPDNSTLCSALAMLRQIKDPAAIRRAYDFAYRLYTKESAPAAPTTKADKQ